MRVIRVKTLLWTILIAGLRVNPIKLIIESVIIVPTSDKYARSDFNVFYRTKISTERKTNFYQLIAANASATRFYVTFLRTKTKPYVNNVSLIKNYLVNNYRA